MRDLKNVIEITKNYLTKNSKIVSSHIDKNTLPNNVELIKGIE